MVPGLRRSISAPGPATVFGNIGQQITLGVMDTDIGVSSGTVNVRPETLPLRKRNLDPIMITPVVGVRITSNAPMPCNRVAAPTSIPATPVELGPHSARLERSAAVCQELLRGADSPSLGSLISVTRVPKSLGGDFDSNRGIKLDSCPVVDEVACPP